MKKPNNEERQALIDKRHIKAVEKLNEELKAFAEETGDKQPELYEDPNTMFTLSDVRVEDGYFIQCYDGREERIDMIRCDKGDDEDGTDLYYEDDSVDSILEYVKFYRRCLWRARKYWSMSAEELDAMQSAD